MAKRNFRPPNMVLVGGPWPGHQVHWEPTKKSSMLIKYGFNKRGRYVRQGDTGRALWEEQ